MEPTKWYLIKWEKEKKKNRTYKMVRKIIEPIKRSYKWEKEKEIEPIKWFYKWEKEKKIDYIY